MNFNCCILRWNKCLCQIHGFIGSDKEFTCNRSVSGLIIQLLAWLPGIEYVACTRCDQLEENEILIIQELNTSAERIDEVNLKNSKFFIHGIVGLKNPQFMINSVKPGNISLHQNIKSPNLGVF